MFILLKTLFDPWQRDTIGKGSHLSFGEKFDVGDEIEFWFGEAGYVVPLPGGGTSRTPVFTTYTSFSPTLFPLFNPLLFPFRASLYKDGFVSYDYVVDKARILYPMKQSEFLLGIIKMFNLYIEAQKDGTYIIEPRDDFFIDDVTDWTKKLDTSKPFVINPSGLITNKEINFNYTLNDDDASKKWFESSGEIFGYKKLIFDNDFVNTVKNVELPFVCQPSDIPTYSYFSEIKTEYNGVIQEKVKKPIIAIISMYESTNPLFEYFDFNSMTSTISYKNTTCACYNRESGFALSFGDSNFRGYYKDPLTGRVNSFYYSVFKNNLYNNNLLTSIFLSYSNEEKNIFKFIKDSISKNFYPAAFTSFIYCLIPFTFFFDRLALADNLLSFFGVFSLIFTLLLAKYPRLDLSLILGFVLGLSWLTKSPAIYFIVLSIFTFLAFNYKKPKLIILPIISSIVALIIYNILRLGPQFRMISLRNKDYVWPVLEILKHPLDPLKPHFLNALNLYFNYFSIPLIIFGLFGLFLFFRNQMLNSMSKHVDVGKCSYRCRHQLLDLSQNI
jgi:hypothetical protein